MAEVKVIFSGDADSATRAARRARGGILSVGDAGRRTGSVLKSLGKVAAVGVAAAFAGLAATVKIGFDELQEGQKVAAQTGAVLKSTGGIANVTAAQVANLASEQSRLTGIDDELIQTGENLLLTFKNVRNEVGAGNDVFNQATKAALDLSVAGFGSVESASKMMGKALNDPIKGMTALGRAGVTFSEEQKTAIEAMVESNNLLGAQKIILQEVESQVGGSARAFGETLPGQLAKARNSFEEVAASVAQILVPYLIQLLDWVNRNMPTIRAVIEASLNAVIAVIEFLVPIIGGLITAFQRTWEKVQDVWPKIAGAIGLATGDIDRSLITNQRSMEEYGEEHGRLWRSIQQNADQVKNWYKGELAPAIENVLTGLEVVWRRFGDAITTIVKSQFGLLVTIISQPLKDFLSSVRIFLALLRGDWSAAWDELKGIVTRKLDLVKQVIQNAVTTISTAAKALGSAILQGIGQGLQNLGPFMREKLQAIPGALASIAGQVPGWAAAIGRAIVSGILSGLTGLLSSVRDKIVAGVKGAIDFARDHLGSTASEYAAMQVGTPIGSGVVKGWITGSAPLPEKMKESVRNAIEAARSAVEEKRGVFAAAFQTLTSEALSAFDQLASDMETRTEKQLRLMDERAAAAERKNAIAEAKAALTTANQLVSDVGVLKLGEDPTAFAERERAAREALTAAQKQLDEALAVQHRFALEQRAIKEREHLDNRLAKQRGNLEDELLALQRQAENQVFTKERMHQRLLALFEKYKIPFQKGALELGGALIEGLREAAVLVEAAAEGVRNAILKPLTNIRFTVHGEVVVTGSKPPGRQHGGLVLANKAYTVGEGGPEIFVPSRSGRILPNSALRSASRGAGAFAGGVTNIVNVTFAADGYFVGSKHELEESLARSLKPLLPGIAMYESRV